MQPGLPRGVTLRPLEPHHDRRGWLVEAFRESWAPGVDGAQVNGHLVTEKRPECGKDLRARLAGPRLPQFHAHHESGCRLLDRLVPRHLELVLEEKREGLAGDTSSI